MSLEGSVKSLCLKKFDPGNSWYSWEPINESLLPKGIELPDGSEYEKNLSLKTQLSQEYASADRARKVLLTDYYICTWGRVSANKPETIEYYALSSTDLLESLGSSGVASWSKALCIRDPDKYVIFDARVSVSLYCLSIISGEDIGCWMPTLLSRNPTISEANKWLRSIGMVKRKNKKFNTDFYKYYLNICLNVSRALRCPPAAIEMLLFSCVFDLYALARETHIVSDDSKPAGDGDYAFELPEPFERHIVHVAG